MNVYPLDQLEASKGMYRLSRTTGDDHGTTSVTPVEDIVDFETAFSQAIDEGLTLSDEDGYVYDHLHDKSLGQGDTFDILNVDGRGYATVMFQGDQCFLPLGRSGEGFKCSEARSKGGHALHLYGVVSPAVIGQQFYRSTHRTFAVLEGGGYALVAKVGSAGNQESVKKIQLTSKSKLMVRPHEAYAFFLQPGSTLTCVRYLTIYEDPSTPTPWLVPSAANVVWPELV